MIIKFPSITKTSRLGPKILAIRLCFSFFSFVFLLCTECNESYASGIASHDSIPTWSPWIWTANQRDNAIHFSSFSSWEYAGAARDVRSEKQTPKVCS